MSNDSAPKPDIEGMDEIQRSEQIIESLSLGNPTSLDDEEVVRIMSAERDLIRRPFDPDAFDFFNGQPVCDAEPENVRHELIGLLLSANATLAFIAGMFALTNGLLLPTILLIIGATCFACVMLLRRMR